MTKDLDKLKRAFEAEGQPLPDEMSRAANISRAMQAFDREFADQHQGSAEAGRLMNTGNTVFNSLWRRLMTPISQNMKPLLLGGVSLAVLSVAVLNTQHIQQNPDLLSKTEQTEMPAKTIKTPSLAAPSTKPVETPEALSFENKPQEESARKGEVRLNDADGNRVAQPKRDDAAQLQAVVGDEAGAGSASSDRRELDVVGKTDDSIIGGNKAPASKLEGKSKANGQVVLRELTNRQGGRGGADSNAVTSNEPVASKPAGKAPTVLEKFGAGDGQMFRGFADKKPRKAKERAEFQLQFSQQSAGRQVPGPADAPAKNETELSGLITVPNAVTSHSSSDVREREVRRRLKRLPETPAKDFYRDQGRDKFEETVPNPVKLTREEPLSTFSIDVDTASYAFMRASLQNHQIPQRNAVRVEELINYFPYDYAAPEDKDAPFSTHVSVMPTPWNTNTKLMHVGIKGYELPKGDKPKANLVFLLDTSGSMNAPNKLPLLRNSFKLLLQSLQPDDTVAIVTYAGRAGTLLEPTKVRNIGKIYHALDRLRSRGSTAGAAGIQQAYQLAERNFDSEGVNRVILATDGDFNVGITDKDELKSYIERKRETGISLSVLGFGMGNYNDALMQTLAQNGNGNASYIDNLSEAQKVLVEEAGSTLFTIAKDVKIQIEFNPQQVSEYRLIGYETRMLKREDFNNDKIDAGEIGAGHTVTAIYEITPTGAETRLVDDLRYQPKKKTAEAEPASDEYALLKLRYKLPDGDRSTKIEFAVTPSVETDGVDNAPHEARFAAAVAGFGQLLRGGRFTGSYSYDDVIKLALSARGEDEFGYRAEFIKLVRLAKLASGGVRYKN